MVEFGLTMVGITKERVTNWLGRPCRCPERKARLNALGDWAARALGLSETEAKEELEELIGR
jgi:hypothetical protein